MKLKIGIAQVDIFLGNPQANQQTIIDYAQKAGQMGVDVLLYPEMWQTGYALTELDRLADQHGDESQALLSQLAKRHHMNIVGGSVATQRDHQFYNTMFVFDRYGQKVSEYDKVHLFGLMNEEKYIAAGNHSNVFNLDGVPCAGVCCYDIRFPEWVRTMMAKGPQELLFVTAEWPEQRIAQWQTLLQARAIENQAFVVAANRVGYDDDNVFGGRSLVIDPLGKIIKQASDSEPTLLVTEIDIDDEQDVRGQIPVFSDRRPTLYY